MNTLLDLKIKIQEEQKEKVKLKKQLNDRVPMEQIKINPSDSNSSSHAIIMNQILAVLDKRSKR